MKNESTTTGNPWQKTQYANLFRYEPSGTYFARIRISGKLIRRSLDTTVLSVAKLRLGDLEKQERQLAEHQTAATNGRMTFNEALDIYSQRLAGDASLKPRTREYHEQRIKALLKSWPELKDEEVRSVSKSDCLNWAARFGKDRSATAFNHTVGILKGILEIGVEAGVRYSFVGEALMIASWPAGAGFIGIILFPSILPKLPSLTSSQIPVQTQGGFALLQPMVRHAAEDLALFSVAQRVR